mmetsp:Transcript_18925/g.58323  ORF Transcript_18925/g.58323 Transcript_18925/m.58323 type:complete len:80 (+) Transcript_18925:21-260(+)
MYRAVINNKNNASIQRTRGQHVAIGATTAGLRQQQRTATTTNRQERVFSTPPRKRGVLENEGGKLREQKDIQSNKTPAH